MTNSVFIEYFSRIMHIFHKNCTLNYSVRIFVKNYINIV